MKKVIPTIVGIDIKAFIKLLEVSHDSALPGLEKFTAIDAPLAPNIKNKTTNKKKTKGIPNNFKFAFPIFHFTCFLSTLLLYDHSYSLNYDFT